MTIGIKPRSHKYWPFTSCVWLNQNTICWALFDEQPDLEIRKTGACSVIDNMYSFLSWLPSFMVLQEYLKKNYNLK